LLCGEKKPSNFKGDICIPLSNDQILIAKNRIGNTRILNSMMYLFKAYNMCFVYTILWILKAIVFDLSPLYYSKYYFSISIVIYTYIVYLYATFFFSQSLVRFRVGIYHIICLYLYLLKFDLRTYTIHKSLLIINNNMCIHSK